MNIATSLGDSNVRYTVLAVTLAFAVGALAATLLWFRWYLDDGMRAIETYAGKEWGE